MMKRITALQIKQSVLFFIAGWAIPMQAFLPWVSGALVAPSFEANEGRYDGR
jgi:hypothetical protein